jgi:SNF2 family DNA or RNA helicase
VGQDSREELVRRALKSDNQVFLINPEAFKICIDVLMEAEWDMMIVDESSMLKSPKSKITKSTIAFGAGVPRRICMTATPRPNSSLDLWGQMAFLDTCLGGNFYDFRRRFYYKGYDGFSWAPKDSSVDMMIRDIIFDRSIRYRLDDCVDLPGENYQYIEVELEGELRAHYDDMHRRMMVQLKDDTVETSFLIVQINKLAQITSGFIFDDLGQAQFLGNSPKIEATLQTARQMLDVEERGVVIWIRFREEARILEEALKKYGVSTMHGGTRDSEASARAFKDGKTRVMIAHAASAKFGHTWVKHCNAAIFHSYDYSWENFYQAKRRIYRIGQKEKVTYFPVIAKGTVDEQIIEAVMRKEADSDSVIDSNFIDRLKDLKRG